MNNLDTITIIERCLCMQAAWQNILIEFDSNTPPTQTERFDQFCDCLRMLQSMWLTVELNLHGHLVVELGRYYVCPLLGVDVELVHQNTRPSIVAVCSLSGYGWHL